ncbi:MAG: MFS transporter, partial [Caldilineaceae bacterium]|nr:MFS transporter [Caldilineaceae bacterium]
MENAQTLRSSRVINATPFFYGWVVVAVGTLALLMMGPSQTFTISIFVDHFVADLGIPRSTVSLLYGAATLMASFLLPFTGRLVDRFGPRRVMMIAAVGLGVAAASMSLARGMLTLWIGLLLLRFFGFGSMQLVANNAVAQWFVRRRGMVMGLYNQSLSLSLVLFPWLVALLIGIVGWRETWIILGALVAGVMLPTAFLFLRDRPELYGLEPDGDIHEPGEIFTGPVAEDNWTLEEARRTPAFWVLAAAFATMTMILSTLAFHQVSLLSLRGLDQAAAVQTFQVVALVSVFSNLAMGRLIDTVSARLLISMTLLMLVVLLGTVQWLHTVPQALFYGALTGLASGSYRVLDSAVWPKYFGRRYLGSIKGVTLIGTLGGTAFGPYPLGLSLDM